MFSTKEIRAQFDNHSITVYQAYNTEIAQKAIENQRFISPPFKMERMTWIKPSFLWMMYRSGWASKKGQERVLAIKIKHEGWLWALQNSCLSHYNSKMYNSIEEWKGLLKESPVRIQWDPERDINLNQLDQRAIQVGLSGVAVEKYINEWIISINDITSDCKKLLSKIESHDNQYLIENLLPREEVYPIPLDIQSIIGMGGNTQGVLE